MDQEQLLTALKDRDPAAVQELVAAFGPRLLRSAYLLCGSESDAQDLVQDTSLRQNDGDAVKPRVRLRVLAGHGARTQ